MQSLLIVAVFLICSCCCIELKPYDQTAMMMFVAEDLDGDGMITRLEIETVFYRYDSNGDGRVSRHEYTEFVCATTPTLHNLSHYLYDEYDSNHDHHLEVKDYDDLFDKMNPNGDGGVDPTEFVHYWTGVFTKYENAPQHGQNHPHSGHGNSACH